MAVTNLPSAELQFCDANGAPYAGGMIYTFTPGTETPATTYSDYLGTVPNANPLTLDAAGRCRMYGNAIYRMQLFDVNSNLIWDQISITPLPTTAISSVMAPICAASSTTIAVDDLGIPTLISNAIAAVSLLPGPIGPTGPTGPQGAAGAAGTVGPQGPAGASALTLFTTINGPYSYYTSPQRAIGPTYYNTTGKPMYLWINTFDSEGVGGIGQIVVNSNTQLYGPLVPNGYSYSVQTNGVGSVVIDFWYEIY